MEELLKGNYKVTKNIEIEAEEKSENNLTINFKKVALNSIGGSMVYVERNTLVWEGEEEAADKKNEIKSS